MTIENYLPKDNFVSSKRVLLMHKSSGTKYYRDLAVSSIMQSYPPYSPTHLPDGSKTKKKESIHGKDAIWYLKSEN